MRSASSVQSCLAAKVGKPVRRKLRKALRKADLARQKNGHALRKLIAASRKLSVRFFRAYGTPARAYTLIQVGL